MEFNVILTSSTLQLNGVNVFSVNLIRGLRKAGIAAHLLITEPYAKETIPLPIPSDVPVEYLPIHPAAGLRERWKALTRYLEKQAPCIYIPNSDWRHSCISPKLSDRVAIIGIVHSDDPHHYEHVARLGKYWNAIVAVSKFTQKQTIAFNPQLSERLTYIPIGVDIPEAFSKKEVGKDSPLKIVYAGKLRQRQKRIFDIPEIIKELQNIGTPFQLTIVGDGPEKQQLFELCTPFLDEGSVQFTGLLSNVDTGKILEQNTVILMTSEFEGLPNVLLEAMGRGCIPVVTDIKSGISELVQDGFNGYLVPIGDIHAFADRLTKLQKEPDLCQKMSFNAHVTVRDSQYRVQKMVENYVNLFQKVLSEVESGDYHRSKGKIIPRLEEQRQLDKEVQHLKKIRSLYHRSKRKLHSIYSNLTTIFHSKTSQ